jgi:uncharacterized protein YggE
MESETPLPDPPKKTRKLDIPFDSRTVIVVLLLVVVGMLFAWKPWDKPPQSTDRTVQVTGKATVKADPDEFVFSPSYDFKNTSKQAALEEMSKKSSEIVSQLKKLGVADNHIKTNADGYKQGIYLPASDSGQTTYTLSLNVTTDSKELAQKVQDYLVSTTPTGAVTPYSNFSKAKQQQLESQAREEAEKDARRKAEQSARNIGFKLGAVKAISETNGFGVIEPLLEKGTNSSDIAQPTAGSGISVQPGQNDFNYQISVTYYIK